MISLKTTDNDSQVLVLLCADLQDDGTWANGVTTEDFTNPGSPVTAPLNWIAQGYPDNAPLSGIDGGGQPTLASLTVTIRDGNGVPVNVYQGGNAVLCENLPFIIRSVAPTAPFFVANGPRVASTYRVEVTFKKPNGVDCNVYIDTLVVSNGN